jgi:hypothetical protein
LAAPVGGVGSFSGGSISITARPRGTLAAAFVVAALFAPPIHAASTPTQLSFSVCPNVTQTIYPLPAPGPGDLQSVTTQLGCAAPAFSANFQGGFTVKGSLSTKSNRGTLLLKGSATY